MNQTNDVPEWVKQRSVYVIYLRDIGYDSATLAQATNNDVKRWHEAEKNKQGRLPC